MDKAESSQRRGVTSRRTLDDYTSVLVGAAFGWAWYMGVSDWLWVMFVVAWTMDVSLTLRRIEEQGKEEER